MGAVVLESRKLPSEPHAPAALVERLEKLEQAFSSLSAGLPRAVVDPKQGDSLALIVFSGSLDRMLAAFTIATGAAAMSMPTTMFFTFWGTTALRKKNASASKGMVERLFGWMLPKGPRELPMSQLNFAGGGPLLMRHVMKKKGAASVEEMLDVARELGVQIRVCTTSMDLLGFDATEIIDYPGLEYCGVAKFLETAATGRITLFV
jgi:peroxiredoxin family protein